MYCGIIEGDGICHIFIPQLVELSRQGRFSLDRLIRLDPRSEIEEGATASEKGDVLEAVLQPRSGSTS
jgi:aryl-alcohol dehydrogenase